MNSWLGQVPEDVDRGPVKQAKIIAPRRNRGGGEPVEHPIEQPRCHPFATGKVLNVQPHGVDDFVPGLPLLEHLGNEVGGVLQVAVHEDDGIAGGVGQPRAEGGLLAEVTRQHHVAHPRVGLP